MSALRPASLRSIPAHTGKPLVCTAACDQVGVYPRPHGEAFNRCASEIEAGGLSPPTRGSPAPRPCAARTGGSIPAHTGKPHSPRSRCGPLWVYPRPHGEAQERSGRGCPGRGLSPPTRGSRDRQSDHRVRNGSIPAHTGKPRRRRNAGPVGAVYPRPHGMKKDSQVYFKHCKQI